MLGISASLGSFYELPTYTAKYLSYGYPLMLVSESCELRFDEISRLMGASGRVYERVDTAEPNYGVTWNPPADTLRMVGLSLSATYRLPGLSVASPRGRKKPAANALPAWKPHRPSSPA